MWKINFHPEGKPSASYGASNQAQSLIGIIIVLVVVGLITSGLYYFLSKQIPEISEITEKPTEEEKVTPPPKEELPKEEVLPEEKIEEKPTEKPGVQKCADGTLYGQCSINKPKYCDNGNLIDKCSICGCPSTNLCNTTSNQCIKVIEPEALEIYILVTLITSLNSIGLSPALIAIAGLDIEFNLILISWSVHKIRSRAVGTLAKEVACCASKS